MGLLNETLSFSKGLIAEPGTRFRELASGGTKAAVPAVIYLLALLLGALFMKIKPADFPAELATLGLPDRNYVFYLSIELFWGTLFSAVSSALLLFFLRFFAGDRFIIKALLSAAAIALLGGAAFSAGRPPLFLALAGGLAVFTAGVIRSEKTVWPRFFLAALAVNLVAVLIFPAELAAALAGSEDLFITVEAAAGLWTLLLVVKMAGAFTGTAIPKAVLALFMAFAVSLLFFVSLYAGGLVKREIFALIFML